MNPRGIFSMLLVCTLFCIITVLTGYAQSHDHLPDHIMLTPEEMKWADGPASLPVGAQYTVIEGDLTKEGPFTARFKLPANYTIPPHWHPAIEHVTVIKGSFHMGKGERFDKSKAMKLPLGGFAMMNIGTKHFAFTTEETIVQIHGIGPWGITYVNEEDDPRLAER
jgi:hypothetical protein